MSKGLLGWSNNINFKAKNSPHTTQMSSLKYAFIFFFETNQSFYFKKDNKYFLRLDICLGS